MVLILEVWSQISIPYLKMILAMLQVLTVFLVSIEDLNMLGVHCLDNTEVEN